MLGAVASKLAVAQSTVLRSSLLLVIARLVHMHLPELLHCLATLPAPGGELPLLHCLTARYHIVPAP